MSGPRVGVVALLQETNSFVRAATTLDHFRQDVLAEGEAVRARFADAPHEVGGFLAAGGCTAVPVFAARALPHGPMTADCLTALLARMDAALDAAGPLDGVLVAPHGATSAVGTDDVDGHWVGRLRARLGPSVPIIATLDPHANLSPALASACDAITAYRTNPHLDQRSRGEEAARLMARTLRGECRPVTAAEFLPLAVNIEAQATAEEPCRSLLAEADRVRSLPGVLAASVVLGFPYADVPHLGASVTVTADGDRPLAARLAAGLAGCWWGRRAEFVGRLAGVAEAVGRAVGLPGPVCLLDMGDNVGGGSPGDGTLLAHALLARGVPAVACLCDPESAAAARAAGVGATVRLRAGGKADDRHGPPVEGEFVVRGLSDGRFSEPEARHGGFTDFDQGPTAVVTLGPLTLVLTTRRMVPFSLRQLTSCGVDPAAHHVLVAKGVHAPVAAYAPVCRHLIRVNTPGATAADLAALPYNRRRRPLFPLEPDAAWPGA